MNDRENQKTYSIGELAELAGVSIRTLHHYDQIVLLNPGSRDPSNGYRRYDFDDLLRLQQILFFRELDFPLKQIKRILDNPTVDRLALLQQHHEHLGLRIASLRSLQATIEKTRYKLQAEDEMPLTDQELYAGFNQTTIDRYNREVRATYDPDTIAAVDRKVRSLSKAQWKAIQAEGQAIAQGLADLMDRQPNDPAVQVLITRQHDWIKNFYPAPASVFRGLGELYATHQEFRAYYDRFAAGLADFMKQAMDHFADTALQE